MRHEKRKPIQANGAVSLSQLGEIVTLTIDLGTQAKADRLYSQIGRQIARGFVVFKVVDRRALPTEENR